MAGLRDAQQLQKVSLADVRAYLAANSWKGERNGNAEWWTRDSPRSAEIFLPTDSTVRDYALRMAQALTVLESVEHRSQLDVLRDINCVSLDVVRVRAPESDPKLNSIELRRGVRLIDRAMDMMSAAASSAVETRKVIPSRKPKSALDYLKNVEMGQSEEGSYVLTILSRVESGVVRDVPALLELMDVPYPRQVTRILASALSATVTALRSGQGSAAVRVHDAVSRGVSANLCEAISGMLDDVDGAPSLDLQIDWAIRLPENETTSTFHFSKDDAEVLSDAARLLREESPSKGVLITGVVINLHREQSQTEGKTTVACVIDGRVRRLLVPLGAEDYERAIEAHRHQRPVFFRADLEQVKRPYRATNVTDFVVRDNP